MPYPHLSSISQIPYDSERIKSQHGRLFYNPPSVGPWLVFLSPHNSLGGGYGDGAVRVWFEEQMCLSHFGLWAWYRLQILPDHFQTSHVNC